MMRFDYVGSGYGRQATLTDMAQEIVYLGLDNQLLEKKMNPETAWFSLSTDLARVG